MPRQRDTTASNTYRFFVPPESFAGGAVRLADPELAHQLGAVLRLGPGQRVTLLDGEGWQYVVLLEQVDRRGAVRGAVERREPAEGAEPRARLTLYLPLIRPERFEWALQKGVEIGVAAFVPTVCANSIAEGAAEKKLDRWRRIVREAAEQSRRGRLPPVERPVAFAEACARAAPGNAMLLWEGEGAAGLRHALRARLAAHPAGGAEDGAPPAGPWSLLSGPEGSLTPEELRAAAGHGIMQVSLGPRTLRAETAPIIAAAAILYELGELE